MLRAALLCLVLCASIAEARSEKTLGYQREAAWPAAVRFIRVDERLKILEKDPDAGYVLFELKEDGKTFRGSLEVMTVVVEGRTLVRFVMQIEDRPTWIEVAMLGRLERKLRSELGSPAPPPSTKKKPEPAPDDKDKPKDAPKPDENGPPISPTP